MLLKMYALTGTALILWVAPLYALDKKISWHRAIQGTSLIAAFSCAVTASLVAKKLADEEAYENAKRAMLVGDLQDELAQTAYLSEQERKLQNQKYLQSLSSTPSTPDDGVNTPAHTDTAHQLTPLLDKAYSDCTPTHTIPENWVTPDPRCENLDGVTRGVIVACIRAGWTQSKTIEAVFGVSKGGKNPAYEAAKNWFQLIKEELG